MSVPSKRLLCFLGPPASGKGSYTKLVTEVFNNRSDNLNSLSDKKIVKVVASDLIKEEIRNDTPVGREMKQLFDAKKHVPPELMVDMMTKKLNNVDSNLILLDGFPRNLEQARMYFRDSTSLSSDLSAIHLDLRHDWARAKSIGRLVCPHCDFPYNDAKILGENGEVEWEDDIPLIPKCKSKSGRLYKNCNNYPESLERRENADIFDQRYQLYLDAELPVINYLKERSSKSIHRLNITGGYRKMASPIIEKVCRVFGMEDKIIEAQKEAHKVLDRWEQ